MNSGFSGRWTRFTTRAAYPGHVQRFVDEMRSAVYDGGNKQMSLGRAANAWALHDATAAGCREIPTTSWGSTAVGARRAMRLASTPREVVGEVGG